MLLIINPFYTIFNEQNWSYDISKKQFIYSDDSIKLSELLLNIPFKDDDIYNKKLYIFLKKFIYTLSKKIYNPKNKIIYHRINDNLIMNNKNITLHFKEIQITPNFIDLNISIINHP